MPKTKVIIFTEKRKHYRTRNNLYICNANPQMKTTLTAPISGSNFGTHYSIGIMNNNSQYPSCAICHSKPANKTNSHIIPSFFIAMVSSVDNSYKRDKELLYTIGKHQTTAYIGRSVKEEDLRDSFDYISEERLAKLSKQTASKDYIFCSHCEKKLGEYLESPWHDHLFSGKAVSPDTAYFFWVSLIWRMSVFEGSAFKLPTHIEKGLGKRLNCFIQAKDKNEDTAPFLNKAPFTYKVLYCKDYSKEQSGFIYSEYDSKSKIASFILGDVAACFSFQKHRSFDKHSFYGLEEAFTSAPINDGYKNEAIFKVEANVFENFSDSIIDKFKTIRLDSDKANIIGIWQIARDRYGVKLPPRPNETFVRYVISELYSDSVKPGEKITHEHYARCFGKGLENIYGIRIQWK